MQDKTDTHLDLARWPDDTDRVAAQFRAYQAEIGGDICFKDFEHELDVLPGDYAAPAGCVILAWREGEGGGEAVGCVGLRALSPRLAEMKRLYLEPQVRGQGLGRVLSEAVIQEARARGYAALRLDTLVSMKTARALYDRLGFVEVPPLESDADRPHPDQIFLELPLV